MKTLNVAIAGYGIVGKRRRACIDANKALRLIAVCDKNFESDGFFTDGIKFFRDFQSLLDEELDILFVCLTNDIAPEVTIKALERNLHVFCEKPPGRNVEDILRVIQAEKKHANSKLMYGFNHRYHDSVKDALVLVRSGNFGRIINMRGVYGKSKLVTFDQPDWRTRREVAGGGILLDQGIHMVDLMRLFAGEFTEVKSFVSNDYWKYEVEDNAYALMRTKDGVVCMFNSSATQWRHRFSLDINMEQGSIILGGILSGTKSYGAETLTIVNVDHEKGNGDPEEQTKRYSNDPSWEAEINVFVECIAFDKPIINGSSLDALNTMKLVYSIYYADPIWREKYSINNPNEGL
jgi:predicted dehydrogenase